MASVPSHAVIPIKPKSRYRALSGWAVVSLTFGVLSLTMLLSWLFVVVPMAGLFTGWMALRRISRMHEETIGMGLAHAGIALSVIFTLVGAGYQHFVVRNVPHGYKEIDFADLQPDPTKPDEYVPPYALELQPTPNRDKKVFIQGFIYPGRQTKGIKEFVLVPSLKHCSFCFWQVKSTELMRVKMVGDLTVDYKAEPIGLGGRLRVNEEAARNPYGGFPYLLEADYENQ